MSGDIYLTMSGNLTAGPKSGQSRSGSPWARLRVASTSRIFDRTESQWRDGETVFLDVVCWRRLAENVVQTLERGDRVLVSGRLHQRSYEDQQGVRHTVLEVEADSVGPDLAKSSATVLRRLALQGVDAPESSPDVREPRSETQAAPRFMPLAAPQDMPRAVPEAEPEPALA